MIASIILCVQVGNGCVGAAVGVCANAIGSGSSYGDYLSLFQLYRHVMISETTWVSELSSSSSSATS